MKNALGVLYCSVRGVRRKLGAVTTDVNVSTRKAKKPVKWIEDATTYSETFSTMVDPFASGPYPIEVF